MQFLNKDGQLFQEGRKTRNSIMESTQALLNAAKVMPDNPMLKAFAETMAAWKAKHPIFRKAAHFRELAGVVLTRNTYDWFTEILDDPNCPSPADHQTLLTTWVTSKLRGVSDTSNWFRPTEALTYKLLATDLRGAVIGDIKLPFPAFYIQLPADVVYLKDPETGWHNVRTLTISQGTITEQTKALLAKRGADITLLPAGRRLVIETYGEPNENSKSAFDDLWSFKSYEIGDEACPVEDVIAHPALQKWGEVERVLTQGKIGERVLDGMEVREMLFKFVLNFGIYLGTEKATCEFAHKEEIERLHGGKKFKNLRKPVQNKIRALQNDRLFDVGTEVTIDPEIREIVRTEGAQRHALTYRTLVRGHWRNQAHGPNHTLRVRKWIEPHIRGADLPTKVVGHNYTVK